jgi:hypothetical protein
MVSDTSDLDPSELDGGGHAPPAGLDDDARELRHALSQQPRVIPPRWLYDRRGSELFSRITGGHRRRQLG